MAWTVVLLSEVEDWYLSLDGATAAHVTDAIDALEQDGPMLGRPIVDRIKGSDLHNLKELRPSRTNTRILFVFDPERQAVLLVAGDKTGRWQNWYQESIPLAEDRYRLWMEGER